MRLKSIQIKNYKGFKESPIITFGKHWTLVVGQNNAGKTALLECLRFSQFANKPYGSIEQQVGTTRNPISNITVTTEVETGEMVEWLLAHNQSLHFPVPSQSLREKFARDHFFDSKSLIIEFKKAGGGDWEPTIYPSHRLFSHSPGDTTFSVPIHPNLDRQSLRSATALQNGNDNLSSVVGGLLNSYVYVFNSERRIQPRSLPQNHLNLAADASNLAGALNRLQTNHGTRFNEFMSLVTEVLPSVERIAVPPADGGPQEVQIKVYTNGYRQGRDDLAIPLEECGTGIGQVLAILFVVATAPSGRILVIDEPNSFLHPGASRVLVELLRSASFSKHQFIVTTHSPEIISAAHPDELLMIRWNDNQSGVERQSRTELAAVETALREVGVRLSDVYGYDALIWVEGETEERCFPDLLKATGKKLPPRTKFLAVINTGDFEGPSAETYWRAYSRLAAKSAIMPETVAISLDREGKTSELCSELEKRSCGLMCFLPRRTYENYLVHPRAIAHVLQDLDGRSIAAEDVDKWIEEHRREQKYFREQSARAQKETDQWIDVIDAARLLNDLWAHFTEMRHNFDAYKVECSAALTDWLLKNAPEHLEPLVQYVGKLVAEPERITS